MLGAFYACSELILALIRRSASADKSRDRNSLRILWTVITASVVLSILAANAFRFARFGNEELFVAGVIVFAIGIGIRWYSIIHLGRFFTVDVSIVRGHRLIDTGPYRYVRHPSYSGALLAFMGFGLCLMNWISFPVLLVPIAAAFLWRIRVEERVLSEALGDDYQSYAARTRRLIPFIY